MCIRDSLDSSICKLELCEEVVETLIPRERVDAYEVELVKADHSLKADLDDIDVNIVAELFRISNPPIENKISGKKTIMYLNDTLGIKNSKYHYYSHVYKYVTERYSIRNNADFTLILATTPGRKELETLLNNMIKAGFIAGSWQVVCLSKIPFTALIHAWSYFERFLDDRYEHPIVRNSSYTLYPVLGVKHGYE